MTAMPTNVPPPRVAAWLVEVCAAPEEADGVLGDLREEFTDVSARDGHAAARRWYWSHALRSMGSLAFKPFRERPWLMLGIGALCLIPTWPLAWMTQWGARELVVRVNVYDYVSAVAFWQAVGLLPLFLAGLVIGSVARRPIAAAVAMLGAMMLVMLIVDPILMAVAGSPRRAWSIGFIAWRAIAGLGVWGLPVLVGAIAGRSLLRRRRPSSPAPA